METNKYKVLLLEDNPGEARLVSEYLREASVGEFEVTHVDRLSKAEEELAKTKFDVVLTDLSVPDAKGLELVSRLLAKTGTLPVIVLTGTYDDESIAHQALKMGIQDYLTKGRTNACELNRAIRYALERSRAEEALIRKGQELETAKKELEKKVAELEILNRAMMGREGRILELKKEIEAFKGQGDIHGHKM